MIHQWFFMLPFLICLMALFFQLCFWQQYRLQRCIHIISTFSYSIAAFILAYIIYRYGNIQINMGNWPYPAVITFRVDLLSALLLFTVGFIGVAIAFYQITDVSKVESKGYYFAYWLLLLGVTGVLCAADLFNLYVWFEDMLIATFILLISHYPQAKLSIAVKYIILNLFATIILLFSIALLYGYTGQLNMSAIHQYLVIHPSYIVNVILLLFILALGTKAALFPVFFWLPPAYDNMNFSSSALFSALLTKISIYVFLRLFLQVFFPENQQLIFILSIIAGLTMITGVLAAAVQYHFRQVLACHIVSQIGYIMMGLVIHTPMSVAGAIFFMIHNMLTKTNLFLISGMSNKIQRTSALSHTGNLYQFYPFLSGLFLISALSLAGIPPLSGFWGKFFLIKSGLMTGHIVLVIIAVVVSFFTLYSMNKLWQLAFQKKMVLLETRVVEKVDQLTFCYIAVILLTLAILYISFYPDFLYRLCMRSAVSLLGGVSNE